MNNQTKKIESEIIEKHAVIVGRIYALKEDYQRQLREQKRLVDKWKGTSNYEEGFHNGFYQNQLQKIKDLEELTK